RLVSSDSSENNLPRRSPFHVISSHDNVPTTTNTSHQTHSDVRAWSFNAFSLSLYQMYLASLANKIKSGRAMCENFGTKRL
ncbi:unnamed protein product, partial [Brachionus calyciflorus]